MDSMEQTTTQEKLTLKRVQRALDRPVRDPDAPAGGARLRRAAVLCPIFEGAGGLHVLFTLRAAHLSSHAGQISFPGGKIDAVDRTPLDAALREAHEEIGLAPGKVSVMGALPILNTSTGYLVKPFVGFVAPGFRPVPEPDEVAEVFSAPLDFLMERANHQRQSRMHEGRKRFYYAIPYMNRYIWGATAAMLRALSDRLNNDEDQSHGG